MMEHVSTKNRREPKIMSTVSDNMLDKIRALLSLAEGASTPAEAEAASAMAERLMAKHGVAEAVLHARGQRDDRITSLRIAVPAPYARDKRDLIGQVALALDCKAVYHSSRSEIALTIIGWRSDVELANLLVTSLLVQAAFALVQEELPNWGTSSQKAAYRRSWYAGFTSRISSRIQLSRVEAKQEAEDENAGTALVWVSREQAVDAFLKNEFGKLRNARERRLVGNGERDGQRAADRADIGTGNKVAAGNGNALR